MVFKSYGPEVCRGEDVSSVKNDAVAHDTGEFLQIRIRIFAPFRGDDQNFRIPGAFVHVFHQFDPHRGQNGGRRVHGFGVRSGDNGSFPAEFFT